MHSAPLLPNYSFNRRSLLDSLPPKDLAQLRKHLKLKKIPKARVLFEMGARPKGLYILRRGKVKIFQASEDGSEQIVYIYSAGEMFGYRPLLCHERHPASAKTIEECGIYFLPAKHFLSLLSKSAVLSNVLLEHLSLEFTVFVNRIASFSHKSVKERVALSLLILQQKYRKPGSTQPADLSLSRSDLAAFVGTTPETIARVISKFKSDGLLTVFGRRISIKDSKRLHQLTEQAKEVPGFTDRN